jgi:hypothetical protein
MTRFFHYLRFSGSLWRVLVFMLGFAILINFVADYYLIPAMRASNEATAQEKRWLVAASALLMTVILFILTAGIILTFRIGRFFFPRQHVSPRTKTQYIDAWAESGRRMKDVPADD